METFATPIGSSYGRLQTIRCQTELGSERNWWRECVSESLWLCQRRRRWDHFLCANPLYTKVLFLIELESELPEPPHVAAMKQSDNIRHNQTTFLTDYLFKMPKLRMLDNSNRRRRQADQYEYTPTKTRCPLLLVADYRFFQEMGSGNTKTTINYLVSFSSIKRYLLWFFFEKTFIHIFVFVFTPQISLIDRVHKIYNDTVWQDRSDQEGFRGMGFVIKKIVVHSEPTRVRGGEGKNTDGKNKIQTVTKSNKVRADNCMFYDIQSQCLSAFLSSTLCRTQGVVQY